MARYISNIGRIWKIRDKSFKKLKEDLKENKHVDLDDYGEVVAIDPEALTDIREEVENGRC